ncbi:MAG: alpha/beta hydrolase [Nanoarchaeota archaeon]|nr:alpha/beta hydrolase [Nanoarchaeota archaeon]
MKAMIIPGNGNTDISENWFPYVKEELEKIGINVIAENMPDPDLARKEYWLSFIEKKLGRDEEAILVGHSSGTVAILRYLETHKIKGAILVGSYYTHLGDEKEKESGYFDTEWQWNKIKENSDWIVIFASTDDPYIPIKEARYIRDKLDAEYYEYDDEGHFGSDVNKLKFPEIIQIISSKLKKSSISFFSLPDRHIIDNNKYSRI